MQKWIAMGRTTKDMEIRYSNDGNAVARFDFAVNRKIKREGEADADFFSCVAFGKIAETFEKLNIGKGTKLLIEGEVRNNNYTNKDGQKVYGTQIVVSSFEFCESKSQDAQGGPIQSSGDGFMNIPDGIDEHLPFN
jgi:single-strand DNA-binding protein